jgi:hypothetical protein
MINPASQGRGLTDPTADRYSRMGSGPRRRLERLYGFAEAARNAEPAEINRKMSASQARKLFGTGVSFGDKTQATEYAQNLASQGYRPYMGKSRGKWVVYHGK